MFDKEVESGDEASDVWGFMTYFKLSKSRLFLRRDPSSGLLVSSAISGELIRYTRVFSSFVAYDRLREIIYMETQCILD